METVGMGKRALSISPSFPQIAPVAWVNMTIFDYASKLQSRSVTLFAWPIQMELEESVHYMGSTMLNPSTTECVSLEIDITPPSLPHGRKSVSYPSYNKVKMLAQMASSQVDIPSVSYTPTATETQAVWATEESEPASSLPLLSE